MYLLSQYVVYIVQEAWHWYHSVVGEGRCDIGIFYLCTVYLNSSMKKVDFLSIFFTVDTWWQTETGGVAISPRPSG